MENGQQTQSGSAVLKRLSHGRGQACASGLSASDQERIRFSKNSFSNSKSESLWHFSWQKNCQKIHFCVKSGSFWRFSWEKVFQDFICSFCFAFENQSHSGTFHRKKITCNYFFSLYLTLPSETSYVTVDRRGTISLGKLTTRCLLFQRNIICCLNFSTPLLDKHFNGKDELQDDCSKHAECRQINKQENKSK